MFQAFVYCNEDLEAECNKLIDTLPDKPYYMFIDFGTISDNAILIEQGLK